MVGYELTKAAEDDLQGVAAYTLEKWGAEQVQRYAGLLEKHFAAIGQGNVTTRTFLKRRPEILVTRCEHHYVFHLVRKKKLPLILAVFHENMDLMVRLRARVGS